MLFRAGSFIGQHIAAMSKSLVAQKQSTATVTQLRSLLSQNQSRYMQTSSAIQQEQQQSYIVPQPQFDQPLTKPEEKRPNVMKVIERESIARADIDGRTKLFVRRAPPKNRMCAGDVVVVESRNSMGESSGSTSFTGVCIAIYRRGIDTSFILRNVVQKIGVEIRFMAYSPLVKRIEIVQKGAGFRRAKLFYLRENPGKTFHLKALRKMAQSAATTTKKN